MLAVFGIFKDTYKDKPIEKEFEKTNKICSFADQKNYGLVAEWLGRGLQNLVQRFESARDLN